MSTHQPSQHLFALLEYVGIRQVDIAEHLGVSKSLVSLWFNEKKSMPSPYYVTLLGWAAKRFEERWGTFIAPDDQQAEFDIFYGLFDAARAERAPDHFRDEIILYAQTLLSVLGRVHGMPLLPMPSVDTDEGMQAHLAGAKHAEYYAREMLMKARYWRKYVETTCAQHKETDREEPIGVMP